MGFARYYSYDWRRYNVKNSLSIWNYGTCMKMSKNKIIIKRFSSPRVSPKKCSNSFYRKIMVYSVKIKRSLYFAFTFFLFTTSNLCRCFIGQHDKCSFVNNFINYFSYSIYPSKMLKNQIMSMSISLTLLIAGGNTNVLSKGQLNGILNPVVFRIKSPLSVSTQWILLMFI